MPNGRTRICEVRLRSLDLCSECWNKNVLGEGGQLYSSGLSDRPDHFERLRDCIPH